MKTLDTDRLPLLLDAGQVGRLLGLKPRTFARRARSGALPEPLRLSHKCVRWRTADVLALCAAPAVEPPDQALTCKGVARLLGVTVRTVARWADAGRLPVAGLDGRHRVFSRAAVLAAAEAPR